MDAESDYGENELKSARRSEWRIRVIIGVIVGILVWRRIVPRKNRFKMGMLAFPLLGLN